MAKNTGIRKTIEQLIKKVETLENQSFGQKLLIDELENKLLHAEETLKQVKENSGFVPFNPNYYQTGKHACVPMPPDQFGAINCAVCNAYLKSTTFTITTTNTSSSAAVLTDQSSTDVEPTLDLDISWIVPDGTNE